MHRYYNASLLQCRVYYKSMILTFWCDFVSVTCGSRGCCGGDVPLLHTDRCVCVRSSQDLISALLPRVLPAVTEGLQDLDDDVRAVAASALIPVVDGLVQLLPNEVGATARPRVGLD